MTALCEWLRRLERIVFLRNRWMLLAGRPFTNGDRMKEIEAELGVHLIELARPTHDVPSQVRT
jgi:hypothetical protein